MFDISIHNNCRSLMSFTVWVSCLVTFVIRRRKVIFCVKYVPDNNIISIFCVVMKVFNSRVCWKSPFAFQIATFNVLNVTTICLGLT